MNVDKLTEIAEWLEAGAPEHKGVVGFDMELHIYNAPNKCGTICCIAGAAIQFDREVPYPTWQDAARDPQFINYDDRARHLLGLKKNVADALFYGRGVGLEEITPAWAARCIRKLIATGEVDWVGTEHA